jgi:DNA repair protein RecO (recombination protein O)
MALLVTDAIVLHAFDYLESSRICRIATREAGLQSVIARGARSSRARFGRAFGPFAGGSARISMKEGRDLNTLDSFEVADTRSGIALAYDRFLGASVVAELYIRFAAAEPNANLYDTVEGALNGLVMVQPAHAGALTLAICWRVVAALGFAPTLSTCASCHAELPGDADLHFSHRLGGALCRKCSAAAQGARSLPAHARTFLEQCTSDESERSAIAVYPTEKELRAHVRLLREFVVEHLAEERPLKAFALWESSGLTAS